MAGSVNKVILLGNLGADPEVKSFSNGGKVCNLRIATSESWKDKNDGSRKEKTEWHSVVINSDGLIGIAERYLKKGSKVYLEGKLQTRKWQDASGQDRYSTEVVVGFGGTLTMLDGAPKGDGQGQRSDSGMGDTQYYGKREPDGSQGGGVQTRGGFADDLDDDIPFATNKGVW